MGRSTSYFREQASSKRKPASRWRCIPPLLVGVGPDQGANGGRAATGSSEARARLKALNRRTICAKVSDMRVMTAGKVFCFPYHSRPPHAPLLTTEHSVADQLDLGLSEQSPGNDFFQ